MPNNTIVPTLGNTESSYVISVQGIAQTPIQVPANLTRQLALSKPQRKSGGLFTRTS